VKSRPLRYKTLFYITSCFFKVVKVLVSWLDVFMMIIVLIIDQWSKFYTELVTLCHQGPMFTICQGPSASVWKPYVLGAGDAAAWRGRWGCSRISSKL